MNGSKRVLITGANGFVGQHLGRRLTSEGWHVFGALRDRSRASRLAPSVQPVIGPDLSDAADWKPLLSEHRIETVVHLASRDHFVGDGSRDDLADYRQSNVFGTNRLATACVAAGVRRFLFLSSIKAVGEGDELAYDEQSECRPESPYGASKLEAESTLRDLTSRTAMELVILRPPLIYGPGVSKSFLKLMRLVRRELPLPLGCVRNQRSFVYVANLVDAITKCLVHPAAANELFHVADAEPLSTPELLNRLASHLGHRSRMIPVPVWARYLQHRYGRQGVGVAIR